MKLLKIIIILMLLLVAFLTASCGTNSLNEAIYRGDVEAVQAYLDKNPRAIETADDDHFYLIHHAAREGQKEILQLLLERGASIKAKTENLRALKPLHLAVQSGNIQLVKFLLEKGAAINAMTGYDLDDEPWQKCTPLIYAIMGGHTDIARFLIQQGAILSFKSKNIYQPLVAAIQYDQPDILQLLIEKGEDVNRPFARGLTPIFYAAAWGKVKAVERMIALGADIHHKAYYKMTPLHYSFYWRAQPDAARVLLEHGADVNARSRDGYTPLNFATQKGSKEGVALLLEKGAKIDMADMFHRTPLIIAEKSGFTTLRGMMLALHNAARNGDAAQAAVLIKKYPQLVNARDSESKTPLHYAAQLNHVEIAGQLIEAGADVNCLTLHKRIPLLHGVVAKILVPKDGRIKAVTNTKTPMHFALLNGHSQMVEMLKQHGGHE